MPGTRITVDSLWKCLCPTVDTNALIRAINSPLALRKRPRARCSSIALPSLGNNQGQARRLVHGRRYPWTPGLDGASEIHGPQQLETSPELTALLRARGPPYRELGTAPVSVIHDALRRLRDLDDEYDRTTAFAKHLLEVRKEPPTTFLYETLVRANCHKDGSADAVREVLRDMKKAKIEGSSALYHWALRALAVHPDYLTRSSILKDMKDRWIELAVDGMQSVAIGLLRDGQYELAVDQLEEMADRGLEISSWVFDVFIYTLGQLGFHDDALKIVNHRLLKEDDKISLNVWYFLLDSCSRGFHYEGIKYVWSRMVRPKLLNPSDGICLNVLNTASQHRDPQLATEAMQQMSSRGTKLGRHHFEAMVDSYAGANQTENALRALCIMHSAEIPSDEGSTRSIYLGLKRTPALVDAALKSLFELKTTYDVPVAAFNVVMEAMLEGGDVERALDLYRHVRQLCPAGPTAATFRLLLAKCAETPHLVNFLFQEMQAFSIKPDHETHDLVVYSNAKHGSLDAALRHIFELVESSSGSTRAAAAGDLKSAPWITRETAAVVIRRCFDEEDARIWEVVDASRERGKPLETIIRDVLKDMPREKWGTLGRPPPETPLEQIGTPMPG